MSFMDGIIILASDGRPLITSRFTSSSSSSGAATSGSGSSNAARAQYARLHVDRYNEEILRAIDSAEYRRLVHGGLSSAARGRLRQEQEYIKDQQEKWWGSVALQEAFRGQKVNNPALEGPDPLGRDEDAEEDVGGVMADEGLLANMRIPGTDFEIRSFKSQNEVPPVLHVEGVPPLSAAWAAGEHDGDAAAESEAIVDFLAPTPAPVSDADNVWHQEERREGGPSDETPRRATPGVPSIIFAEHEDSVRRGTALFHKQHNDLHFLIPVSNEVPPLLPLTFLSLFIRTLTLYVGGAQYLTEDSVRDNFDIIYQLIEEMLDDGGSWPLTTDANLLLNIVPPERGWRARAEAWAEKVGASLSAQQPPSEAAVINAAINSPVTWRTPSLRYSNNEIYVDVVETLEGTIGRNGKMNRANLYATVISRTRLTGMPDILLSLSKSDTLHDASFHPCVRTRRWRKERVLSFIPPDGACEVATFRVGQPHKVDLFEPSTAQPLPRSMPSPAGSWAEAAPLDCRCHMRSGSLESDGSKMRAIEFEIKLDAKSASLQDKTMQEIVVSFELPEDATNVDAALTAERGGGGISSNGGFSSESSSAQQDSSAAAGSFIYDSKLHIFRWYISKLRSPSSGGFSSVKAKGSFETYDIGPRPASNVTVQLQVPMYALSGVKVDSLLMTGEAYKPFKGVRNVLAADLEVRWA